MENKLEHYKELLSVLPRNNIKNSRIYFRRAVEIKNETVLYRNSIVSEIKRRYEKLVSIQVNENIEIIENHLSDTKSNLYLLNKLNTPYEKSGLDKVLYDLGKYYKSDLEKVNEEILLIIDKFKTVGVFLTKDDFDFGNYVSKYMRVFFEEKDNLKSSVLKETFDEIYWKCPDLIHYIKINFRYLYFKNIKSFEKFYLNRVNDLNVKDGALYYKEYKLRLKELIDLKSRDIKMIEDKFLDGTFDLKEYSMDKIDKIVSSTFKNNATDNDLVNESRANLIKLSHTLHEYKEYVRFKYIIDAVKSLYQEKASSKGITKNTYKNIEKQEKRIIKGNSMIKFKTLFGKYTDDSDKIFTEMGSALNELKSLYKEYDSNVFKENVCTFLNDKSTVLDCLQLAYSYRMNLLKIIESNKEGITNDEIVKEFNELLDFINYPNLTIINNLTILDEKDIPLIIVDKYKLMEININKEMLEESNLDNLISNVDKLLVDYYIKNSEVSYDDISFVVEAKKIIEKNSN